jgi:predicted HTH domain antitoxin
MENHGQPEVTIVDIVDFELQRAAIHCFSSPAAYQKEIEINEATLQALPTDQDRFNLVIGHYLAVPISIGRSAELLAMSSPELQVRLGRSGIPLRMGPESQEELDNEVKIISRSLRRK